LTCQDFTYDTFFIYVFMWFFYFLLDWKRHPFISVKHYNDKISSIQTMVEDGKTYKLFWIFEAKARPIFFNFYFSINTYNASFNYIFRCFSISKYIAWQSKFYHSLACLYFSENFWYTTFYLVHTQRISTLENEILR